MDEKKHLSLPFFLGKIKFIITIIFIRMRKLNIRKYWGLHIFGELILDFHLHFFLSYSEFNFIYGKLLRPIFKHEAVKLNFIII